jgi:tetratricopeptide (TPR) repeat protein
MALKLYLRFALALCLDASLLLQVHAQDAKAPKGPGTNGAAYSSEASSPVDPQLVSKESTLRAEIAKQPDSAELLYDLALVLRLEGKARDSLDTYTRAASERKPTPAELDSVALDYVLLNDFADAIHWLEVAAAMAPNDTRILYALGRCYYTKDRFMDAGTMFARVLAIQPDHLKAEENLGLVYDATNRPDVAEEAFRKAASWANPHGTDEWPFLDFGSFLLDQDRPKEAVDPLRTAAQIKPDCAACHEKLGRSLLATHDDAGAVAELERAAELDSDNPKTHYELGRALRQTGQTERAQKEFQLSQKLYSSHSHE